MNIRACKGCRYFVKHYGNMDSTGKRKVSNYWCIVKNGFIKSFPKKCKWSNTRVSCYIDADIGKGDRNAVN